MNSSMLRKQKKQNYIKKPSAPSTTIYFKNKWYTNPNLNNKKNISNTPKQNHNRTSK
jgi:hypothetical protein